MRSKAYHKCRDSAPSRLLSSERFDMRTQEVVAERRPVGYSVTPVTVVNPQDEK